MPPIVVYGPDRSRHTFAEGTKPEVIDAAMGDYVREYNSKQPIPGVETAIDMARSVPGGLAKGVTGILGIPGTIADVANSGLDYVANKITGQDIHTPPNPLSGAKLAEYAAMPFGGYYKPKTTMGRYAETAASFAPAAFGGEASLLSRAIGRVAAPAAGSQMAGSMVDEKKHPVLHALASTAGAIAGGSPAIANVGARLAAKKFVPNMTEALAPEDAALVAKAEGMGLPMRPGQYHPSNFVRQGDAVLADSPWPRVSGFGKDSAHAVLPAQQAEKFNRMLISTFGEDAPRATSQVIENAHQRIGKVYETVLPRNAIRESGPLNAAIKNIEDDIANVAPGMKADDLNAAMGAVNRIKGLLTQGDATIPGKLYQAMRKRGGLLDELESSSSSGVQSVAGSLRKALDEAFAAQAPAADAAALRQASEQYRNLMTLKPIMVKAPAGDLTPFAGQILGKVNSEFGHAGNAGKLGDLAQIGAAYLKPLANSGTAERTIWRKLINSPFKQGIPALADAAVSFPVNAIASRQVNKMINSPEMRAKLLANALQNGGAPNMPAGVPPEVLARALQP